MTKILIADDDADMRENLLEVLKDAGYDAQSAASGTEALEKAKAGHFDIMLLDLIMPEMSGIEVLSEIEKIAPRMKVIIITAFSTVGSAIETIKKGATDYLSKPFKIDELLTIISRVIEEAKFEKDIKDSDFDAILISLANPLRRKILKLLNSHKRLRFMELIRELDMELEHQKVVFHLKLLRKAGIIEHEKGKFYMVTKEGEKALKSLDLFEKIF